MSIRTIVYVFTLHNCTFRRVDEFSEYGDLDMMMQYVKDVQTVQRKLAECNESITFINEVNHVKGHAIRVGSSKSH